MAKKRSTAIPWVASQVGKIGVAAGLIYMGYTYNTEIGRVEDKILYHKNPIAQGFFKDPQGIDKEIRINDKGEQELYITYDRTGWKLPIMEDGYPPTDLMIKQLAKRMEAKSLEDKL